MTLYENKITREVNDQDENERIFEAYHKVLMESSSMTVDDFIKKLEGTIKKSFPTSHVVARASKNLGSSIFLQFALGKNKSEWQNGIIQNDPLFSTWMIGWNAFTDGYFIKDKIEAELSSGGSLTVNAEEGSHMAYGSKKIGWRKKTAPHDKIIAYFGDYFKKVKKVAKDNKHNIPPRDLELIGKKI